MANKLLMLGSIVLFFAGCDAAPTSGRGFTLPAGNVTAGRAAFVRLNCHACHTIADIDQLVPQAGSPEVTVPLGGEVSRIQTYGELVTSIINPSHRFAKGYSPEEVQTDEGTSKMINYNDAMTVAELADLVTFLQSQYKLRPVTLTPYRPYY